MIVVRTNDVGIVGKLARQQRVDRLIRTALHAAVKGNARALQRRARAAANAAADQRIHLQHLEHPR